MSVIRLFSLVLLTLGTGNFALRVFAQEPSIADVLASTPDRANAILYVDVPAVRTLTKGSLMEVDLSESIGEVRIAADLNLKLLEPLWEIGYITVTGLPDTPAIAKSVDGYVDTIVGREVVWSIAKVPS